jgi:hypothetical protein
MRRSATSLILLLAALVATTTVYGGALRAGATNTRASDRSLLVPFAAPWLALGTRGACGGETGRDCGPKATYAGLQIAGGLVQAASVVQIALAFVHGDLRYAKDPAVDPSRARRLRGLPSGLATTTATIEERNAI